VLRRGRALAAVIVFLAAGCFSGAVLAASASDPPRIVPWTSIGGIWLGQSRIRVEYVYGSLRSAMSPGGYAEYRLHGGRLFITYLRDRVAGITTTSRYYRTSEGLGVGTRIPLGRCHRVSGRCEYRWRGFTLVNDGRIWIKQVRQKRRGIQVQLWVTRGAVTDVSISYWDRRTPGYECTVDPNC